MDAHRPCLATGAVFFFRAVFLYYKVFRIKFDGFVKSPSPRQVGISQDSSGVALHPRPVEFSLRETAKPIQQGESLQRTSMYASFLK
jgi:hypothetical protein